MLPESVVDRALLSGVPVRLLADEIAGRFRQPLVAVQPPQQRMGVEEGLHELTPLRSLIPGVEFVHRQGLEEGIVHPGLAAEGPKPAALFGRVDGHEVDQGRLAAGDDEVLAVTRPLDQPRQMGLGGMDGGQGHGGFP